MSDDEIAQSIYITALFIVHDSISIKNQLANAFKIISEISYLFNLCDNKMKNASSSPLSNKKNQRKKRKKNSNKKITEQNGN